MIVVTGATGPFGRLAVESLLVKGVAAGDITAAVRTPDKAAGLAAAGVKVVPADYTQPETLRTAFAGADSLLMVSGSDIGRRLPQHRNVLDAAKAAGISRLAYTSILAADTSKVGLAAEHKATEALIRESGIAFTLLRNAWYLENYTEHLAPAITHGVLLGSAGDGRVNAATRADYAEAAATVLTTDGHTGKVYELAGDRSFDYPQLAAEIAVYSGKPVEYRDLSTEAHIDALTGAGVPRALAENMADWDAGVKRGDLASTSTDLHRLIGRDTTSLATAVKAAIA